MIVKPFELRDTHDPLQKAGQQAEEQMAFYLKRAFADSSQVMVFNDLRINNNAGDDFAQIDHLVVFPHGMFIVESKSVTSAVKFNEHGEWLRLWNNDWQGMSSPIQQAKLQVEFLRNILQAHRESIRRKGILGQYGFKSMPVHILIAISDRGRIERGTDTTNVLKADQVTDRIKELIQKTTPGLLGWIAQPDDQMWPGLDEKELGHLKVFLLSRHRPLTIGSTTETTVRKESLPTQPEVQPKTSTDVEFKCRHCNSQDLLIAYGHNYYFKCSACAKSTPIDYACPKCSEKAKLRKAGRAFYKECGCSFTAKFFENTL